MKSKTPAKKLTKDELEDHLIKQLGFLKRSANAFDAGFYDEATRMAQVLRILFHDTKYSHSLLGLLDMKKVKLIDTSPPIVGSNKIAEISLVQAGIGGVDGQQFFAPLNDVPQMRKIPAENWWKQTIMKGRETHVFSRSRLVRTMADQDGGAHVDPVIDGEYSEISRGAFGIQFRTEGETIEPNDVTNVTIRQIAHEVLASLDDDYQPERTELNIGAMISSPAITFGPWPPKKHPPNEQCPCSSGLKYKKCHGLPPMSS